MGTFLLVFKKTLPLTPSNGIKYENVSCMKCVGIYSTIVVDESYSSSLIDLLSVIWKQIQHNQWRSVALISRRCSGIMWVDFHRILSFFLGLWDDGEWLQKTVSGLLSVPVKRSGTVFVCFFLLHRFNRTLKALYFVVCLFLTNGHLYFPRVPEA